MHIYTYTIVLVINSLTTSAALNTNSKLIKKGFIRVYIDKCWPSLNVGLNTYEYPNINNINIIRID